jgi:NADPH:quinone reductase-like Zn-dependent oxidoreductase
MKAAQLIQYGGRDSIKLVDSAQKPIAKEGEVLVAVHAASVNPFDWKLRDGMYQDSIKLRLPAVLGGDVAGTVAEIGEGVTGFQIGQEVYGMANAAGGQGSFAGFTPVSAKQLAAKPTNLDFTTAAALPLAGSAAYQALVETMDLQAGQRILIHGGAGGIGSLAIQLAKQLGAYVATTISANDASFVTKLGADEKIDYKTQDFSLIIKNYDAVFDTVGGKTDKKSYQVLKQGGILVSMLEQPDAERAKKYGINYVHQSTIATTGRLTALSSLVETGKLEAIIDKTFSLDQAAEALEYLKTGHPHGKVVIKVQ